MLWPPRESDDASPPWRGRATSTTVPSLRRWRSPLSATPRRKRRADTASSGSLEITYPQEVALGFEFRPRAKLKTAVRFDATWIEWSKFQHGFFAETGLDDVWGFNVGIEHVFYNGLPMGEAVPWRAWLAPLAWWTAFMVAVWTVMVCLMVLVRRQWVEHERLAFPLTHPPLELLKGNDTHLARAGGTEHGIGLPHLLDEFTPFWGRRPPRAMLKDIDDFDLAAGRLPCPIFRFGPLIALPAHFIGVPAIVAHELKMFIWDVLGDGGDKLAGGEDFKVALDLGVHAGAVDDGAGFRIGVH